MLHNFTTLESRPPSRMNPHGLLRHSYQEDFRAYRSARVSERLQAFALDMMFFAPLVTLCQAPFTLRMKERISNIVGEHESYYVYVIRTSTYEIYVLRFRQRLISIYA